MDPKDQHTSETLVADSLGSGVHQVSEETVKGGNADKIVTDHKIRGISSMGISIPELTDIMAKIDNSAFCFCHTNEILFLYIYDLNFSGIRKLVFHYGANVNYQNEYARTPLHAAATVGSVDIAHFFIQMGADVNAKDKDGLTPLHAALSTGKDELVELLKKHGAIGAEEMSKT